MIYTRLVRDLDEDDRLEVDAVLGDEEAVAERQRIRRERILALGGVIA